MQNKHSTYAVDKKLHRLNTMCNDWIKEFGSRFNYLVNWMGF